MAQHLRPALVQHIVLSGLAIIIGFTIAFAARSPRTATAQVAHGLITRAVTDPSGRCRSDNTPGPRPGAPE
jgi:hypothetical protein